MSESQAYLTLKRTAQVLGVHEQTLRRWEKRGIVRMVRLPGSGYRRVPVQEVRRLQAEMAAPRHVPGVRLAPPRRDADSLAQAQALAEAVCAELADLESATTLDEWLAERRGRQ